MYNIYVITFIINYKIMNWVNKKKEGIEWDKLSDDINPYFQAFFEKKVKEGEFSKEEIIRQFLNLIRNFLCLDNEKIGISIEPNDNIFSNNIFDILKYTSNEKLPEEIIIKKTLPKNGIPPKKDDWEKNKINYKK